MKGKLNQELEHIFFDEWAKMIFKKLRFFYNCPWMPIVTFILTWPADSRVPTSHSSRKNYANDASVLLLKWVAMSKKESLNQ